MGLDVSSRVVMKIKVRFFVELRAGIWNTFVSLLLRINIMKYQNFFCSFLASVFLSSLLSATGVQRPNIIVIYSDDQGFGDSSALNPEAKFITPNLDRLAKEGVSFTNGHSSDSVCTPSRYGLLTGRYSWRTKTKKGVQSSDTPALIAEGRLTLGSLLQENGYNTAMVGKWHLGMDIPGTLGDRDFSKPIMDMPLDRGFDYFYGIPASLNYGYLAWIEGRYTKVPPSLYTAKKPNDRHSDYRIMPPYFKTAKGAKELHGAAAIEVAPDFVDTECLQRFVEKSIEWLSGQVESSKAGTPFFLYLPFTSPHYPVAPRPEFWGQGAAGGYGEFMIETDHHVGQVIEFLEKSGLDENTMIIYSSDNGPERTWAERIEEFDHDSSSIYRDGKRSIYEGGHRVPFFVRWPAGIQSPGRSWDNLVGQVDVLSTVAEMIGAEVPDTGAEDSQSFYSVLIDPKTELERLPLINHAMTGRFSITEGKWKLIMPHKNLKHELYNLEKDPGEETNVYGKNVKIATRLEKRISEIVCGGRTTDGAPQPNDTGYWEDLAWLNEGQYNRLAPK